MEFNLYLCKKCLNVVEVFGKAYTMLKCCSEDMTKLEPNTVDAAKEKHIPFVSINDNTLTISVGETIHPMSSEHFIKCVYILDDIGNMQKISFKSTDEPKVTVTINQNAKKVKVYSYCNLHGLWLKEIEL